MSSETQSERAGEPTRHELEVPVRELTGVLKIGPAAQLADETARYQRWVQPILRDAEAFLDMLRTEGTHAPDPPLAEVPTGPDPDDASDSAAQTTSSAGTTPLSPSQE